jgi:hypothetical protein
MLQGQNIQWTKSVEVYCVHTVQFTPKSDSVVLAFIVDFWFIIWPFPAEPVVIVAIWRINREVVHGQIAVSGEAAPMLHVFSS